MTWKPLPDTLSPESARFVTQLRAEKDRAGVSLAVLAEHTAYSKSSWERCLNGRALPPPQAVQGLCRLTGQPCGPLLALRDLADLTWTGRPAPQDRPDAKEPPSAHAADPTARRSYPARVVTVIAALIAVVTLPLARWTTATFTGPAPFLPEAVPSTQTLCTGRSCQGEQPTAMWCSRGSDTVVRRHTAGDAWFEVRRQPVCGAVWGLMWFSRPGDRLVITLADERREVVDTDRARNSSYHYTPMLVTDIPRRVVACYVPRHGKRECSLPTSEQHVRRP